MGLSVFHLTTEPPYPAVSGGRVRSAASLSVLDGVPEVTRVTVQHLREDADDANARERFLGTLARTDILPPIVHPIHVRQHLSLVPRILALRGLGVPYLAGKWSSSALVKRLREVVPALRPDVLYIDHLGMMHYAHLLRQLAPRARMVLEQHNVESDFFAQRAERASGVQRQLISIEAERARTYEATALREVDAVIAISPIDAAAFADMAGVRAHVVPQIVPIDEVRTDTPSGPLLYVGNLGWHPNVAGLDWFFAEVWPRLRARDPELRLRIAGSGLAKDAQGKPLAPSAWQQPGVEILGFVPDLGPLYRSSSLVVAPIHGGSGVRIKLLEAMRAGLPLVTTTEAVDGTLARPGEHLEAHTEPAAFADAVLGLATDPARRVQLRDAAYDFLRAQHSRAAATAQMRAALGIE